MNNRRTGVASQNQIMSAINSVNTMIPMVEDFAERIKALEEEVATLKAKKSPKKKTTSRNKSKQSED